MDDLVLPDDVVRAALEFIDGFYDNDVRPKTTAQRDEAIPRPGRHSSQRTRAEIQHLRGVVTELEGRVQQLTQSLSLTQEPGTASSRSDSWRDIALHRKLHRFRAQHENARLLRVLEEQKQLARALEKRLTRGRRTRLKQSLGDLSHPPRHPHECQSNPPLLPSQHAHSAAITTR